MTTNKGEFGLHTLTQPDGECYAKGFNIKFDNGLEASIQFGEGNYCDNRRRVNKKTFNNIFNSGIVISSKTAEVAVFTDDESYEYDVFTPEIFGKDVLSYVTPNELINVLIQIANWKPELKE